MWHHGYNIRHFTIHFINFDNIFRYFNLAIHLVSNLVVALLLVHEPDKGSLDQGGPILPVLFFSKLLLAPQKEDYVKVTLRAGMCLLTVVVFLT